LKLLVGFRYNERHDAQGKGSEAIKLAISSRRESNVTHLLHIKPSTIKPPTHQAFMNHLFSFYIGRLYLTWNKIDLPKDVNELINVRDIKILTIKTIE
jgi:hypothetical protein